MFHFIRILASPGNYSEDKFYVDVPITGRTSGLPCIFACLSLVPSSKDGFIDTCVYRQTMRAGASPVFGPTGYGLVRDPLFVLCKPTQTILCHPCSVTQARTRPFVQRSVVVPFRVVWKWDEHGSVRSQFCAGQYSMMKIFKNIVLCSDSIVHAITKPNVKAHVTLHSSL